MGFYRAYIPNYGEFATPLTELTKGKKSGDVKWGKREEESFCRLKKALCEATALNAPDFGKSFEIHANASDYAVSLSFHDFRPRFALFRIVRTGRIDVPRGLVSASVVSRVVAINSSRIKGPYGTIASVHSSAAEIFAKPRAVGTARLFEFHRPQVRTSNFVQATPCWNKALLS
ncbi:hypothetical protein AVEN_249872-1 [Araneus ventricosus]|uniref:Reverse transcriptase/retrotransposon-derived protein RNase H-like domain-containing protein n=1 Tax=Araneus ventricosus TaxID=182803 RepID=A0A4Y2TBQ4_ARAVE|nr:hypothetical protein AVEN_249872-1 [Araneus ventricosus]